MHVHVAQLDGVALILAAMRQHQSSPEVAMNGSRVLANLALTGIVLCITPSFTYCIVIQSVCEI